MIKDGALDPAELVVFKLDAAAGHAANLYHFIGAVGEDLVQLGPVDELQLDLVVLVARLPRERLCVRQPALTPPSRLSCEEADGEVGRAEGYNEAVL